MIETLPKPSSFIEVVLPIAIPVTFSLISVQAATTVAIMAIVINALTLSTPLMLVSCVSLFGCICTLFASVSQITKLPLKEALLIPTLTAFIGSAGLATIGILAAIKGTVIFSLAGVELAISVSTLTLLTSLFLFGFAIFIIKQKNSIKKQNHQLKQTLDLELQYNQILEEIIDEGSVFSETFDVIITDMEALIRQLEQLGTTHSENNRENSSFRTTNRLQELFNSMNLLLSEVQEIDPHQQNITILLEKKEKLHQVYLELIRIQTTRLTPIKEYLVHERPLN